MTTSRQGRPRGTYSSYDAADIDHLVVERCTTGTRPAGMTYSERVAVVHRLHTQGVGVGTIAVRLRMSGTRVHELLQRQPISTTLPAVARQHPATVASRAKEQEQ